MSGGSYNYLFRSDLLSREGDLMAMADRLLQLGYPREAKQTRNVIRTARRAQDQLAAVWRAVEWLDSGDSGPEAVKAAVRAHRARRLKT